MEESEATTISGTITLYGLLQRIGGAQPKAWLRLDDGQFISCDIETPLAVELASKLYSQVGVRGTATWDVDDLLIQTFKIEEILDYEATSITESFDILSKRFGQHFDDIDDVDNHVRELRDKQDILRRLED